MIPVKRINDTRALLRQAYELAIQIEALDSYVGDELIYRERRQFQFQMEQIASKLGFDLIERGAPRIETPDNVTSMSR